MIFPLYNTTIPINHYQYTINISLIYIYIYISKYDYQIKP